MTEHPEECYGISPLLSAGIAEVQEALNKNLRECLYGDRLIRMPTRRERIAMFFKEIKLRFSNAYDCLVKGVDPYDGY